jgi:phage shock protein E
MRLGAAPEDEEIGNEKPIEENLVEKKVIFGSQEEDMKRKLCLILIIIMIAGFASPTLGKDAAMPVVIDVRTVQEWDNGHLEGAVLIPYDQIGERIGSVVKDKSQKIYVYCRTGHRAKIAKEALEKLGYKDIINLGSLEDAAKTMKRKIVN